MKYNDLLPLKVVWKHEEDFSPQSLSKEEEEIASSISHPSRNKQFTIGRQALKSALKSAGLHSEVSILRGPKGEPLIPAGYSGSISHSKDSAIAAAAKTTDFISIGIDIEHVDRELNKNTYKAICNAKEMIWLKKLDTKKRILMIVSAKEALYKMLYPLCGKYFGMLDAELLWDETNNIFTAVLLKDLSAKILAGSEYQINTYIEDEFFVSFCVITN